MLLIYSIYLFCNFPFPHFFKLLFVLFSEIIYSRFFGIDTPEPLKADIKRKFAVVTGGHSGFGREFVKRLLLFENYDILLLGSSQIKMKNFLIELEEKFNGKKTQFFFDESTTKEIHAVRMENQNRISGMILDLKDVGSVYSLKDLNRNIDLLFLNAGILKVETDFLELCLFKRRKIIDENLRVNLMGHYNLFNFLRPKISKEYTKIIFTSSSVAFTIDSIFTGSSGFFKGYSRSKLGVLALSSALKKKGYKIIAIHPGVIITSLFPIYLRIIFKLLSFVLRFKTEKEAAKQIHYLLNCKIDLPSDKLQFFFGTKEIQIPSAIETKTETELLEFLNNHIKRHRIMEYD